MKQLTILLLTLSTSIGAAFQLPPQLTLQPPLGNLNCPFPSNPGSLNDLKSGKIVSIKCNEGNLSGIKFWISLGDVTVKEAAALWWDVPGQTEMWGGHTIVTSGSMATSAFGVSMFNEIKKFSKRYRQESTYRLRMPFKFELYEILVDVPLIWIGGGLNGVAKDVPGSQGFGKEGYRFYRLGDQTIYEGFSMFSPTGKWNPVFDQGALWAAGQHQKRYTGGRRPIARTIQFFESALADSLF